jgi:hypothetical protein
MKGKQAYCLFSCSGAAKARLAAERKTRARVLNCILKDVKLQKTVVKNV